MSLPTAHVPMPDITIDAAGTARSQAFDDVYFSARGGIAETEHVYLAGNDLPARWQGRAAFTIGELGFGTGLNFLTAWQAFCDSACDGILHFVSIEKYPLTHAQLAQALAHHPSLAKYVAALLAQYPLRLPGLHRLHFGRVTLTLGFGDVADMMGEMDAQVDAWFLDGFTPAKNPAMWSDEVCTQIARLSAADATLASFTVASAVRRSLAAVGFTVEKAPGFGFKRNMLQGRRATLSTRTAPPRTRSGQHCIVIGAGIAGCTVAHALATRGVAVTLLERGCVAHGASGNAAAVLYPQLTKYYTPASEWHLTAYSFTLAQIARWRQAGLMFAGATPGMLKTATDAVGDDRLRSIATSLQLDPAIARWVDAEEASQRVGAKLAYGGFWFAHGTWIAPAQLCRALTNHAAITVREQVGVQALERVTGGGWRVSFTSGESMQADHVVLANAVDGARLLPQHGWKMGQSAGQVSELTADLLPQPLRAIVCHQGYAIGMGERVMIGATYDRADFSGAVTTANHVANLAQCAAAMPTVNPHAAIVGGRTSMRATTPSRLPYVGAVDDGLYVSVGHGSRGMISAPLAAELLAAQLCGEPLPVRRGLRSCLDPHR